MSVVVVLLRCLVAIGCGDDKDGSLSVVELLRCFPTILFLKRLLKEGMMVYKLFNDVICSVDFSSMLCFHDDKNIISWFPL